MNPLDVAKDLSRIGTTAGLSKDVIDLLEKKVTLLTDKISTLEQQNAQLRAENKELRQQAQKRKPTAHDLQKVTLNVLRLLFESSYGLPVEVVAQQIDVLPNVAKYHLDELLRRELIDHCIGLIGYSLSYDITAKGRKLVMELQQ
jgi:hypothetical protein